jgi:hypothetical protein
MRKRYFFLFPILALLVIAGCATQEPSEFAGTDVTMFKSASCGCCGIYSKYMDDRGFSVDVQNTDMDTIKTKYSIPSQLESCHTTIIGDYFVEGHVPIEAIDKLLDEQPDIAGIALPGMPIGTPGMPGRKNQPWIIHAVHHDGSTTEFMRI